MWENVRVIYTNLCLCWSLHLASFLILCFWVKFSSIFCCALVCLRGINYAYCIHVCDINLPISVTWLVHVRDMMHLWHTDIQCRCYTDRLHWFIHWFIISVTMTHSCVWHNSPTRHDLFMYVTWFMCVTYKHTLQRPSRGLTPIRSSHPPDSAAPLYIYMCVCIYVYIYIYTCICIYDYICICLYTNIYA